MDDELARRRQMAVGDPERLLLTPEEAAEALRLGRTTIYALIKNRELHAVHIGRSCRLSRAELDRYVARLDRPAAPELPTRRTRRTVENQAGLFDLDPTPPAAA